MTTVAGIQLFVGNIPWKTTEDDVRQLFETNNVDVDNVRIIREIDTNKSMGYCFVTVDGHQDIGDIVEKMSGQSMGGRELIVERAKGAKKRAGG